MNRTYVLSKVKSKQEAIAEAEKLNLTDNPFLVFLVGNLYSDFDNKKALHQFETALDLAKTMANKNVIRKNMERLRSKTN
ncbi:MAG: hypothetical protein ABIP27_16850 [Flavobacterium circumlabens]|uniref:hypothetical protein n=1 Tax=Flavobacterium circumlabens TaxID=2133765 RepID=UPI0032676553